jgi:hypothetical protein
MKDDRGRRSLPGVVASYVFDRQLTLQSTHNSLHRRPLLFLQLLSSVR